MKLPFLFGFVLLAFAFSACSSIPDFRPSKPVEEASSLNEALDLCNEYEIKGEQNSSGRARPTRVVVMTPWIRCFETVFRKNPEARQHDDFIAFFRAMQSKHDGVLPAEAEVIYWPTMNYAVHAAIAHLKDPKSAFTNAEKDAIDSQLPNYGMFLAESGRLAGTRSRRAQITTQDLLSMHNGVESPGEGMPIMEEEKVPPRPLPLSSEQNEYCKKYRAHRNQLHNFTELDEYKRVLESQTYSDVTNANERAMKNRVGERHEKLKAEIDKSEKELAATLAAIQAKASWFRNGHCLQTKAVLSR